MSDYDDIIGLPHHRSKRHPPMSKMQRAAQFSAFAALRGFDEEIAETARLTEERPELSEEEKLLIGEGLREIAARGKGARAEVTRFLPDEKKTGGKRVVCRGAVKADAGRGALLFEDGTSVPFDQILEIILL